MQSLDITKMSGEELAELLGRSYEQYMIHQQNITAIQVELAKRKKEKGIPAKEE